MNPGEETTVGVLTGALAHERVTVARGRRSGLPVVIAVHSTALGPALGGCRLRRYAGWSSGLEDALRLSEAMTYKAALAGLANGGGKTVVALPPGASVPTGEAREALLHDVADAVSDLDGAYQTGPDVGTGPADMDVIGRATPHVFCRTVPAGGSGDSGPATADGTVAALLAVAEHLFGTADVAGLRIGVLGLGSVGSRLTRTLAAAGARLQVGDIDPGRRGPAERTGAQWFDPDTLVTGELDLLVPAAVGGLLTRELSTRLRCAAVVGPANNQLAYDEVAPALHDRGVLWVPDYLVSAGGIVNAVAREQDGADPATAAARVRNIGGTVSRVLRDAADTGTTPHAAAMARARALVAPGPRAVP